MRDDSTSKCTTDITMHAKEILTLWRGKNGRREFSDFYIKKGKVTFA